MNLLKSKILSLIFLEMLKRDIWTILEQACDKLITALVEFGSIQKV